MQGPLLTNSKLVLGQTSWFKVASIPQGFRILHKLDHELCTDTFIPRTEASLTKWGESSHLKLENLCLDRPAGTGFHPLIGPFAGCVGPRAQDPTPRVLKACPRSAAGKAPAEAPEPRAQPDFPACCAESPAAAGLELEGGLAAGGSTGTEAGRCKNGISCSPKVGDAGMLPPSCSVRLR